MSSNATTTANSSTPNRQPAKRVLATELQDATEAFTESDEERAPNFTILPTGERANRVFIVGTLTDTENVGSDSDYYKGEVNGPTGTFYIYAGQYQPDAASALRSIEPPEYVAVIAKISQFENDSSGDTMVALKPESITVVDKPTRNRWVGETAGLTRERIQAFDTQESEDSQRALDTYGDDLSAYENAARDAIDDLSMENDSNTSEADSETDTA